MTHEDDLCIVYDWLIVFQMISGCMQIRTPFISSGSGPDQPWGLGYCSLYDWREHRINARAGLQSKLWRSSPVRMKHYNYVEIGLLQE